MGMDLVSDSGETFDLSGSWWWFYRTLAEHYGWRPKGTEKPDHLDLSLAWQGNYDSCDGQTVHEDDAISFGLALTKAMADPDLQEVVNQLFEKEDEVFKEAFDFEYTQALVNFCRLGRFQLE